MQALPPPRRGPALPASAGRVSPFGSSCVFAVDAREVAGRRCPRTCPGATDWYDLPAPPRFEYGVTTPSARGPMATEAGVLPPLQPPTPPGRPRLSTSTEQATTVSP